jgi:hypothetical protein
MLSVGSACASLFDVSGRVFQVGSGFWALDRVSLCLPVWRVGSRFLRLDRVFLALGRVGPCLPVWHVGSDFVGLIGFFGFGSGWVGPCLHC